MISEPFGVVVLAAEVVGLLRSARRDLGMTRQVVEEARRSALHRANDEPESAGRDGLFVYRHDSEGLQVDGTRARTAALRRRS